MGFFGSLKASQTAWAHAGLLLVSAFLGLLLGSFIDIFGGCGSLIEPFLMVLLFFVFVCVDLTSLKRSFHNTRFSCSALLLNFVWTPVFAYLLGLLFFNGDLDVRIGLVLLLVTPCTDWYLTFTKLSGGDVALGSSILPVNLILQIVLLPVYLILFFGVSADIDVVDLLKEAFFVVIIPVIAAAIFRTVSKRSGNCSKVREGFESNTDEIQLAILCFVIFFMFSSNSGYVTDNYRTVLALIVPLIVFFFAIYVISSMVGKGVGLERDGTTSLIFTTVARNSPLALAIASATFSDSPIILVILAVVPLIELPVLSVMSFIRTRSSHS